MTSANPSREEQIQQIAQQLTDQGFVNPEEAKDQWVFLIDPGWQPLEDEEPAEDKAEAEEQADGEEEPAGPGVPLTAIVGGWLAGADGSLSRFNPNPDYEPSTPNSPTDPVDAALRLVTRGEMDTDTMFSIMKEAGYAVALDENDAPIVAPAPDDVPSLLATTAPLHRKQVRTENWREVDVDELVALLNEHEVDLLLNPGAPCSMRLIGSVLADKLVQTG
ncbi:type VII secretion system-associated protein [Kibdelosporangium philippinense]|uniref:Type VII secretion system-associated protein n=1 Tax=Kibdelosporangium philippinense TaxID=211113 RepID=A0ABS8ZHP9_9PSEU|nr:type VII secretion system-associated protein [Kibdelosporangium philippinense]MCE7007343.1 type VII secretion system-associated protein [Kibdelosporangium philippinense]